MAVLLAFSSPAAADYSGDKPLTIYDHATINGGLVYETITDGSGYKNLNAILSETQSQDITIRIPAGATVKMAMLYNTYCWSKPDFADAHNPGAPAEADLTFSNASTTRTKSCVHGFYDEDFDLVPNPIYYGTDAVQYWDTKNLSKYGGMWDFPSGEFAWDVTDMVTGSGTYTATIKNADSTPTPGERFVTFGFGLLVIYEDASSSKIEYWIAEGCDILIARTWETPENATTSATFAGSIDLSNVSIGDLTAVTTCADGGLMDPPKNMMYFNGEEIGPALADGICHYGVNVFDVTSLLNATQNVVEFQDRDDDHYVHNAFLVLECCREEKPEPPSLIPFFISGFVHCDEFPVDNPGVVIKNMNTGEEFTAENSTGCNYYQVSTSLANVSCGNVLRFTCNETSFDHRIRQEEVDAGGFMQNVTVMPPPPCPWTSYPAIASGLEDIGDRSTPAVFNMGGTWYLIAGENDGTFNGYTRTGTAWVSDSAIVSGLGTVGVQSTPAVFYKDEDATWYLISGRSTGGFVGYRWTGTTWVSDTAIVLDLGTVVSGYTAPTVFCMDGTWYLISGNAYGRFDYGGRRWDAASSGWVKDFDIVLGLGDVGEDSTSTIFNADGTWYLIAGAKKGDFTGYRWTGTVWKPYLAVVPGLEDVGDNSAPSAFNKGGTWYLISGDTSGTFNGFKQVCEEPIPANVTIEPETLNLGSKGEFTAYITLPEPYYIRHIVMNGIYNGENYTLKCEGAEIVNWNFASADGGTLVAKFDRTGLREDLPTGDAVRMTVTGYLYYGKAFAGNDTVTVIGKDDI